MNHLDRFRDIRAFVFDVDGVLTNCTVLVAENGQLLRTMNVRDGFAMKMAIRNGYKVAIITAGRSTGVETRLNALGIEDVMLGREDKAAAFEELAAKTGIVAEKTLYMGDDLPDLGVLRKVGLPTCPADATPEIKAVCQYISPLAGGMGCVREVIEKVMKLNGEWPPKIG
jgi:3-deoxy-D-manno-octulosonate 8-phosphate phosphatase (KDO 8-P phosphatase)